jgi:short chain dehydrogenase
MGRWKVARVFITGSSDGLGLLAARLLIEQGHEVVVHGRNDGRSRDALAAAVGAQGAVTGDLSTITGARTVADQVNKLGRFDAVIHNAGVGYREGRVETEPGVPSVFAVNVLAPYILTALIEKPDRLVYLSSGTHHGVRLRMDDLLWTKRSFLELLFGLCGEQALRCFAGLCRRSPLERRQIQCAGAWMGSDKDGRPLSAGRSSSGVRNPGLACYERGRVGAVDWWVFLPSTPSCAEPDRERRQNAGRVTR